MPAGAAVTSKGNDVYKTLKNNTHSSWWKDPGLRTLNIGIFLTFGSATANGFDASLMNGLLSIPAFNSNVTQQVDTNVLGLIIAAISLGGLPCLIPAGYVSDHFGRKKCIAVGTFIMVLCSIIQAVTSGPWAFLGTKIGVGAGIAFVLIGAPPLSTEVAHPRMRGQVSAAFQTAFYWGAIISAIATLGGLYVRGSWAWRMPVILQIFFPLLQLIGLFIIPESPRWLVANNHHDKALAVLARFHANGDASDPLVQYEFAEIREVIAAEMAAKSSSSWSDFFATSGNRHRFLICVLVGIMIQWAGNGIVSYYLAPILASVGVTNPTQQASINLALQVWNAAWALIGAFASERYGRRPLWLTSASGMLVCFAIVTALSATYAQSANRAAGLAVIPMLFLFFAFYDIAFTPLSFSYPVEILPYKLRSRGLSVTLTTIFAAGFFNQYVNPIALEKLAWRFYFVYLACLAAMIVIIWFLFPETKGRSLEEIAVVFDGEGAESRVHRRASIGEAAVDDEEQDDFEKKKWGIETRGVEQVRIEKVDV